jgi:uncharacterized protein with NRDE domain
MSKLQGPLFSLDARGQLGKALVYAIWKGLNYARKYVIPANPNTAAQQTIRGYFTTAVAAYGAEDQATKDAWDAAIKKKNKVMTGFNFYVGLYVKYLIDNAGTPPTPPFMPPS